MNNILLVSDLDGTLLDRTQRISRENETAIRRFMELGGRFTLATGRTERSVEPYVKQLGIELPVILYNGAKVVHPVTGETLYERLLTFPAKLWERFLRERGDELAVLVYQDGEVYAPWRNELLAAHERKDGVTCKPLPETAMRRPVTKLLLIASELPRLHGLEQLVRGDGVACGIVYSESNYLEILPDGATKGNALAALLDILRVDGLRTVAVGDNLNDLSMVQTADRGYAVANAHPGLRDIADVVTVHHEQHAIAAIVKDLVDKRREPA